VNYHPKEYLWQVYCEAIQNTGLLRHELSELALVQTECGAIGVDINLDSVAKIHDSRVKFNSQNILKTNAIKLIG
jgi:hypothetical protein